MNPIRRVTGWATGIATVWPLAASAEEAAKPQGYGAGDYGWLITIAAILVYGVYDTFLKKP